MRLFLIFFYLFLSVFSYSDEQPLILIASDFDGTITQTANHSFLSPIGIYRTDNYKDSSAYAIEKALEPYEMSFDHLPFALEITQEESLYFKSLFNKDGVIPNYKVLELDIITEISTRKKKQIIIPGIYQIEYRDGFRTNRFLMSDYRKSKKLAIKRGDNVKDLFSFGLDLIKANLKKKNSEILIHTARGQSSETFLNFFNALQKDKLLTGTKEDLSKIKVYPMSRPESVIFGSDIVNRKVELMERELKSLELKLKPQPYREVHIVFADDELNNIYSIHNLFEKESKSPHLNRVYFHILFAGATELLTDLEIQNKQRFVTYFNGIQSPISKEHAKLIGLPLSRVKELSDKIKELNKNVSNCKQSFIKGA